MIKKNPKGVSPKYEFYIDGDTHIHICNGNDKLGKGIYNWSFLPTDKQLVKKDGTVLTNIVGTCGGVCSDCRDACYAKKSTIYHNNSCIPAYGDNTTLYRNDPERFFAELQTYIDDGIVSVMRFHVSGEIPDEKYFILLCELARNNPKIIFYGYTKRFDVIEKNINEIPNNLVILASIWHKNYDNPYNLPEFIYDDGTELDIKELPHCPAVDKNGNETGMTCAKCKRCFFAKNGDRIAVYAH